MPDQEAGVLTPELRGWFVEELRGLVVDKGCGFLLESREHAAALKAFAEENRVELAERVRGRMDRILEIVHADERQSRLKAVLMHGLSLEIYRRIGIDQAERRCRERVGEANREHAVGMGMLELDLEHGAIDGYGWV